MSKGSMLNTYSRLCRECSENTASQFLRRAGYANLADLQMTIARETGMVPALKRAA
jgi:hypothetical protein